MTREESAEILEAPGFPQEASAPEAERPARSSDLEPLGPEHPAGAPRQHAVPLLEAGTTFLHPALDYLLVGGGLSVVVALATWALSGGVSADAALSSLPVIILISNCAHFAASTVRLYTKEDSARSSPFLTALFPLVTFAVTTAAIAFPEALGRHLTALFLAWSPYHYSAQAYGLAVMYCYRSGARLSDGQKWVLWSACMATFAKSFIASPERDLGLWWILPWDALASAWPGARAAVDLLTSALGLASAVLPLFLVASYRRATGRPFPGISLLIVGVNALWFFAFKHLSAITWATVFHGIQYLAIVTIFHVRDELRKPTNRRSGLHHALWFYAASLTLGYLLFQGWPCIYTALGFGYVESSMLVVAVINLHHFIVDRAIWRLRKDSNFRTVAEVT